MSRSGKSGGKSGGKFGEHSGHDPFADQDPFASVPDVDERLADWVDGTMSPRDRERFEAEMRVSPHLRDQVADYEGTVASIREALNDETHEVNLADRVMASLAQEANGIGKRSRSGWPLAWAAMSAAALLGITVLIDSWGGAMLSAKVAADTAAHLDSPANAATEDGASEMTNDIGAPAAADGESSPATVPIVGAREGAVSSPSEALIGALRDPAKPETAVPTKGGTADPESIGPTGAKSGGLAKRSRGGPGSLGGALSPPSKETPRVESVETEAATDESQESMQLESAVTSPGGVPDSGSSDGKPGKGSNDGYGGRGRQVGQDQSREYLMRLSEKKSVGEVLPLITLEGFAVRFELAKGVEERLADQGRAEAQTGSGSFSLGFTGEAQAPVLRRFFDAQMRPAVEWSQADSKWYERHTAILEPLDAGIVTVGGLQLFAVGPVASAAEVVGATSDEPNSSSEANTKPKPPNGVSKPVTPGEWAANGGGLEQRDWLVVGPKPAVAELLITLRKYSDNVNTRTCRTGEVSLVKSDLKRSDRARRSAPEPNATPGKPETRRVPAGSDPESQTKPSATTDPSPAVTGESMQRVVIRFRVRR